MKRNLEQWYAETEAIVTRCKARRLDLIKGNHLNEEVWAEVFGESNFHLEDGYARIYALSKTGILHIYKRVRLEEAWLKALCSEVNGFKALTQWPRGELPKGNPWKCTYFPQLVVAAPLFDMGLGQYKVVFPARRWEGPKPTMEEMAKKYRRTRGKNLPKFEGTTVYFEGGAFESEGMPGWMSPRRQVRSRPWVRGDGEQRPPKPPKVWCPKLNDEELDLLLEDKCSFIRHLHRRFADDLKSKKLCVMDIKDMTEELLKSLE